MGECNFVCGGAGQYDNALVRKARPAGLHSLRSWRFPPPRRGACVKAGKGENFMRRISLVAAVLILTVTGSSLAQEWIDYTSRTDFFHVNFPGQPKVQDINYKTEYGITLPGHVYSVDNGASRYSVTAVNYADAEKIHTARAEQCQKSGGEGDACTNSWRGDVQGSIVYASWQFFQRNAKVTDYAWYV